MELIPTGNSTQTRSILIADVVSSTSMYEQLGDERARTLIAGALSTLTQAVETLGGRVVKSLGDGLLTSFPDKTAVQSALRMIEDVKTHGLQIRIGIHHGTVMIVDRDVFGDVVNTAARIAAIARPSEILFTRSVLANLTPENQCKARSVRPISVKGKSQPLELFSILSMDTTDLELSNTVVTEEASVDVPVGQMRLFFGGETYVIQGSDKINIGRGTRSDIIIQQNEASRSHACLHYREPYFLLTDSSTNGTFIAPEYGECTHVVRREVILRGRGLIYPGAPPANESAASIEYEVG